MSRIAVVILKGKKLLSRLSASAGGFTVVELKTDLVLREENFRYNTKEYSVFFKQKRSWFIPKEFI